MSSTPTGINFAIGSTVYTTPFGPTPLAEGQYTIAFAATQFVGGITYNFQSWNDGVTNPSRTINLTTDVSLAATFLIATHTLSITSNPSGITFTLNQVIASTTTSGGGGSRNLQLAVLAVTLGTVQTPYFAVLDEGTYNIAMPQTVVLSGSTYSFQGWADGVTTLSRTINLTADISLQANYVFVPPTNNLTVQSSPIAVICTIDGTANATPVTVNLVDGSHTIAVPATVTSGGLPYNFAQWEDGSTNPTRTINLSTDTTITASYMLNTVILQVNSTGLNGVPFTINGQTQVTPYSAALTPGSYTIGMPSSVRLLPPTTTFGTWDFKGWTDGILTTSRTINLTQNTTLIAMMQILTSWNLNVPYNPIRVTIEEIIGNIPSTAQCPATTPCGTSQTTGFTGPSGGASLQGGWPWLLNPDGNENSSFGLKRRFTQPGTVAAVAGGAGSLGPFWQGAGVIGPTFVQIDNLFVLERMSSEDASDHYNTLNGSALFPPNPDPNCINENSTFTGSETATTWGDTTGRLVTNGMQSLSCVVTPSVNQAGCFHSIHTEFDRDWKASGRLGASNNADYCNLRVRSALSPKPVVDIQGFAYWDPCHICEAFHFFSGYEIHPHTAWRLH